MEHYKLDYSTLNEFKATKAVIKHLRCHQQHTGKLHGHVYV